MERGPRVRDLEERRTKAIRSITWLGVIVGIGLVALAGVLGSTGDLLSLLLGGLAGALVALTAVVLARWLSSLDRRAVVHLEAGREGVRVELRDGRAFRFSWSDPHLGLSAAPSSTFSPALLATVRLPGVTGLVPGFLVGADRWSRLVELAREAGAPVRESSGREGPGAEVRIGRGG